MPSDIRTEEFDVLIWEISSTPHRQLLNALGTTNPVIATFPDCPAVVAFLHDRGVSHAAKDGVLATILRAHAQDKDPRWRSVLLAAFWPGLDSLHVRRAHWDQDPDEVWQDLITTFLEVLCRLDPTRRTDRFAQKIINDTIHRLHDRYQRRWRLEEPESLVPPRELPHQSDVRAEPVRLDACIDLHDLQERGAAQLRQHLAAGTIDDLDLEILIQTRLHGVTVADLAARLGITFDCAKKRRQRAEAAIRGSQPVEAP
jgi:DNA-directed RNA polymerase specialized sigma24 family protein